MTHASEPIHKVRRLPEERLLRQRLQIEQIFLELFDEKAIPWATTKLNVLTDNERLRIIRVELTRNEDEVFIIRDLGVRLT
jgi:hypothetical protein